MAKSKLHMSVKNKKKVIDGLIKSAEIVAKTYGYSGHDVCLRVDTVNHITNDGVSVANHIFFDDELMDIGSSFIRGITLNSDVSSGDGTTTAAILSKEIILGLQKILLSNRNKYNMLDVKNGMNKAVNYIEKQLSKLKWEIEENNFEDIYDVAYTATRDEELSELLSEAFMQIGKDGRVLYSEKEGDGIEIEYRKGFNIPFGYSTLMLPNVLHNPLIFLYNERINSAEVLKTLIKVLVENQETEVAIIVKDGIADLVMQQILSLQQSTQVNINLSVIVVDGSDTAKRRLMKDISVFTGADLIDNNTINNLTLSNLGRVKNFNASDKMTTLVDGNSKEELIDDLIKNLNKAYENKRNDKDKESIKSRIANLKGQVAIIKIGGLSRERVGNYKDKIKDAVGSIKNAIDNGVVKGGGIALLDVYKESKWTKRKLIRFENKEEEIGFNIVLNSLTAPIRQILDNSYANKKIRRKVLNTNHLNFGYDAKNKCFIEDVTNSNITDPYLTVLNSLKNAVDLCTMFINLEGFIIVKSEVMNE